MIQIQTSSDNYKTAFLHLGFRPFFTGAALFSVFAMSLWLAIYEYGLYLDLRTLPTVLWHGHEMIYGYGMAVIAGFLLTAVRNLTGVMTLNGVGLLILFILWLAARILPFIPYSAVIILFLLSIYLVAIFRGAARGSEPEDLDLGRALAQAVHLGQKGLAALIDDFRMPAGLDEGNWF